MIHTDLHDTDAPSVTLQIELTLPTEHVAAFLGAVTGDDRDVLAAAERAMRERIDAEGLELDWAARERDVIRFLEAEESIEQNRERLYGPRVSAYRNDSRPS